MLPYRAFYPHAGLLLPNTAQVADRVIVLPTGATIGESEIETIADIVAVLSHSKPFESSAMNRQESGRELS